MKILQSESRVVLQPNQKGLRFYADQDQALVVFDALIKRLKEKGLPYNFALVPQSKEFIPGNISTDTEQGRQAHAIFLFMLCFWMRGGVESDTAARFLKKMHEEAKEWFDPSRFRHLNHEDALEQIAALKKVLGQFKLDQRVEENARGWVYNMRKLARFWQGDPRKLMDDSPSFDVLACRIMWKKNKRKDNDSFMHQDDANGFMLFQEKMVSMITYYLMDTGLVPVFYTPVPVDFHVLRLLTSCQVLRIEGKTAEQAIGFNFLRPQALRAARYITEWFCRVRRISPIALCDCLWLLSRNFCRNNPGNSGYVADEERKKQIRLIKDAEQSHERLGLLIEQLYDGILPQENLKGRKRYMGLKYSHETIWKSPARRRKFEHSCGHCPIHSHCKFNISAGAYYVGGNLVPERKRLRSLNGQGDFFGDQAFKEALEVQIHPGVRFAIIDMPS